MYSIKQASIGSGVSVPLIRAWERRYGVVSPKRTPSGYRLYDDEAIATLLRVKELTDSGWSASEASRAILAGEILVTRTPAGSGPREGNSHARHTELIERFVESATVVDSSATGAVLDEMFALGSFESIVDDLLMPALVALGRAWSEGALDVAAEHAASAAAYRRLSALYEAAAVTGASSVVVGLPPGARHELGALAFSVALRRLGVGVLYLGADVPVTSWVHVLRQDRTRLAVVAIVQASDRSAGLAVMEALRAAGNTPVLAVGGSASRWDGALEAGIVVLPDRINEAALVAARLATGRSGRGSTRGAGT
jgi:DNA-binding transcriptional MerR regulator/methylmalonyl-CoA mutase cobalamin-binding subunit